MIAVTKASDNWRTGEWRNEHWLKFATLTPEGAASRGAYLMDSVQLGWARLVDLEKLDSTNKFSAPSQVFGGVFASWRRLKLHGLADQVNFGLCAGYTDDWTGKTLTEEWRQEILLRLAI